MTLDAQEIRRQARRHLDSLRDAGVSWLPAPLPRPRATAQPIVPSGVEEQSEYMNASKVSPPEQTPSLIPAEIRVDPTFDERRQELAVLAAEVAQCQRCPELAISRTQTVFGIGPVDVELCFVGEAPGADEDAQGEPFVGAAGQLLNKIIAACKLSREEVYICNTLKCRPPNNRTPLPNESANCRGFLIRQLELVRPKFLCALGSSAAQSLLGTTQTIGKLRGRFHDFNGIPTICTYHPAYLLPHRSPDKKKDVWEDMKMLLTRMGRPIA